MWKDLNLNWLMNGDGEMLVGEFLVLKDPVKINTKKDSE